MRVGSKVTLLISYLAWRIPSRHKALSCRFIDPGESLTYAGKSRKKGVILIKDKDGLIYYCPEAFLR